MKAEVKARSLSVFGRETLVRGTVGMKLPVELGEDWERLQVTAVFSDGQRREDAALTDGALTVPASVLQVAGRKLRLSFRGVSEDGAEVRCTNIVRLGEILDSLEPAGERDEPTVSTATLAASELPDAVKTAALTVAGKVAAVRQADSIVFLAASDAHQLDTSDDITVGNRHAAMAMKALSYALPLDFACFLGDYTAGSSTTTLREGLGHIQSVTALLDEAFRGLPQFRTVGNHDPLGYSFDQNGSALSPRQLYALIGSRNALAGNQMGSLTQGYCCRDFAAKRLRVICLNTAEGESYTGNAEAVSDEQKLWFAETLAATPTGYGIVILGHHPLDWGNIMSTSHVLRAYVEQGSVAIGGQSYDFAGKNRSAYVLQFHGHTHAFTVDQLHWNNAGVGTAYDAKRIAIPNMCFGRNNEYGQNGAAEYYGLEFGESQTYPKTSGTAQDTALCVCVVNPTEQKVYALCYGAGYDRELSFAAESVAVTGVSLSSASGTLNPGGSLSLTAAVTPANATDRSVLWASSDTAVATVTNGTVTAVAAGSCTITATTRDGGYSASFALTVEAALTGNIIPKVGYTDGVRLSTGSGEEKTAAAYVSVGFIDLSAYASTDGSADIVIRTRGVDFWQNKSGAGWRDSCYVLYNVQKTHSSANVAGYLSADTDTSGNISVARAFDGEGNMTLTITGLRQSYAADAWHYLRFCGLGTGANLDVRVNEEFE